MLRLPWWWLLFPPLVQCVLSANIHGLLVPLVLIGGGTLAGIAKVYAVVPLAILGRWRALAGFLILLAATVPILPWATYIGEFGQISQRLDDQTKLGVPILLLLVLSPAVLGALVVVGRERAAWLAVGADLALPAVLLRHAGDACPEPDRGCAHGATGPRQRPACLVCPRHRHLAWTTCSRRRFGSLGLSGQTNRPRRADSIEPMAEPDLDVVVLGGGGHVGLPLSLAFAQAGLRVGIYDTNQATLDRIAAGEMPFMENGADELLPRDPADRPARVRQRRRR